MSTTKEILDLFNDICENHHIDNIDLMSKEGQEILQKIIKEGEQNPDIVKYKGLFRIIQNHFKRDDQIYYNGSPLYGAERFRYMFHPMYNKYVYLIGERHDNYLPCKDSRQLVHLIHKYLLYTDKFIDVFTEIPLRIKGNVPQTIRIFESATNIITSFRQELQRCLQIDKSKCELYNVRFHDVDPRHSIYQYYKDKDMDLYLYTQIITGLISVYINTNDKQSLSAWLDNIWDNLENYQKELKNILKSDSSIKKYFIDIFTKFDKLDKNLKNIKDNNVSKYLTDTLLNEINKMDFSFMTYDKLFKSIGVSSIQVKNADDFEAFIIKFKNDPFYLYLDCHRLFKIFTKFMDVYTISRLFREYQKKDYQNSKSAKFSIIITGDLHTQNYIKMLTDLGFITRYESLKDNDGCVRNIQQPLFGNVKNDINH